MASKSKSGKDGKTTSSSGTKGEVITVRLSPKLKYGLELLSRKQHRPLSSVVTWAIEQMMTSHEAGLFKTTKSLKSRKGSDAPTEEYMLEVLWNAHQADRLVKLATYWPELMTYEEDLMVDDIKEHEWGWPKKGDSATKELRNIWSDLFFHSDTGEWMESQEPDWDAMRK